MQFPSTATRMTTSARASYNITRKLKDRSQEHPFVRTHKSMKHWMTAEKTTPPKQSAIAKTYHLTGAKLACRSSNRNAQVATSPTARRAGMPVAM